MRTLKVLGFLLTYPLGIHTGCVGECRSIMREEKWLSERSLKKLEGLLGDFENKDLLDLQSDYVELFDRTPSLSLHLFEHVHGDSRDRGMAMVDLVSLYGESGLDIDTEETPDYLPLFLEYLSILSPKAAKENLGSVVNILCAISRRLENRGSNYSFVFDSIIEAASKQPDYKVVEDELSRSSGETYSLEKIDKEWEEQFAFDNSDQTIGQSEGCAKAKAMLDRMDI